MVFTEMSDSFMCHIIEFIFPQGFGTFPAPVHVGRSMGKQERQMRWSQ